MKKAILSLIASVLAGVVLMAQPFDDGIGWSADRPLTWDDFKATPNESIKAAASTSTILKIEYDIRNGEVKYYITSTFSPSKSWVRHKLDHILKHEQGHFDISEIFARKLHQRMLDYKFNKSNYRDVLGDMYRDIQNEKEAMQDDYDRETRHSVNKEQQAAWEKKIARLLKETEPYANYPRPKE